jgi:hypothetical protein
MDIEQLKQNTQFLDVLKIVKLLQPIDLELDDFKDINRNLNIALASGDGCYDKFNKTEYQNPNVAKYQDSARIHIYLPDLHFDFDNFNWILKNNFQNKILIIWLDISRNAHIPEEFIELFENKVDYITTDDIRWYLRPDITASILKENGFIKVEKDDKDT